MHASLPTYPGARISTVHSVHQPSGVSWHMAPQRYAAHTAHQLQDMYVLYSVSPYRVDFHVKDTGKDELLLFVSLLSPLLPLSKILSSSRSIQSMPSTKKNAVNRPIPFVHAMQ